MSAVAELMDRARVAGLELIDRGDKLRVRGPEPLPSELLEALHERKAEILRHLRCHHELIELVWEAGCWLVITGDRVRAVPRGDAASERLAPGLLAGVEALQAEVLHALTQNPWREEMRARGNT